MTKEQFLGAVNDIDDKFIKELAEIAEDPQKNDPTDEKPQVIYLKSERVPFWNIAAAVLVCVIAAGIFVSIKMYAPGISSTDSTVNSMGLSGSGSDPISVSIADPGNNGEISERAAFTATIDPNSGNKTFVSDPVRKSDSGDFAEITLKCQGVTENNPLYISVCRKEGEKYHAVSDEIKFTGDAEKIVINYTETVGTGDELVLMLRSENGNVFAAGLWNP